MKKLIAQTLNKIPNLKVEDKISNSRRAIIFWSREQYKNSQATIKRKREELEETMTNPHTKRNLIQAINAELAKVYQAEEAY